MNSTTLTEANKNTIPCLPACQTDHVTEAEFEHNCDTYVGSASMSDGPTTLGVCISASRIVDSAECIEVVGFTVSAADRDDQVSELTPAQARELAAALVAAADLLDPRPATPVRYAPKRARRCGRPAGKTGS